MKNRTVLLSLLTALCFSCTDPASPQKNEPAWVKQLISYFEAAPVGNPPQSIWKYEYKGNIVYYVPPQCCDMYSDLYDIEGKIICHPDGGITGSGDGRCTDFFSARQKEVLVWQDPRQR
jgi:hypothetical protein